jgi:hypothetical protein
LIQNFIVVIRTLNNFATGETTKKMEASDDLVQLSLAAAKEKIV